MKKTFFTLLIATVLLITSCGTSESGNSSLPESSKPSSPKTITEAIAGGFSFTATLENVVNHGKKKVGENTYKTAQGIATDGEYLYYVIKLAKDAGAIIVKTDLNGNEIAYSENFDLGHANDMTYDSKNNRLIVVHGSSSKNTANGNNNGRRLSFFDPDTLTLIHTQANIIPSAYAAGAIAYNAAEDRYYISQGGTAFRIASIADDFTVSGISNLGRKSKGVEGSTDYTAQGMGTDGTYIYFPMSGEEDNIIVVYSLDGSYVTTFHLPTTMESESLVFVNGKMYVCFNSSGAVIAEVAFTLT